MKKQLKKLNYANVMATLGVFIALGGTSYAAVKIDGSNVRDGSLTGRDVKNGSLTGRDIKDRSIGPRDLRKKLLGKPGPRGATGSKGAVGPEGPAGQRGPSLGTVVHGPRSKVIGVALDTVAMLELEPGNWVLSTSGLARNELESATNARCFLNTGRAKEGGGTDFLDLIGETGDLPLQEIATTVSQNAESFSMSSALMVTEPLQVHLICQAGKNEIRIRHSTITAIQTAELTDQSKQAPS